MTEDEHVKLLFRFHSNILDEETVETMWATIQDKKKGVYRLDNIPFYAPMTSGDIVYAEFDKVEQMLTYRHTIEHSKNSTIQVILMDQSTEINQIRDTFNTLGCISEKCNSRYFSMEVPGNIDYSQIKSKLNQLEISEIIEYAEPSLSEAHCY